MSITKIESKYNYAKDYIIDDIIGLAELINLKKANNICCCMESHTFNYLCRTFINAFNESFSIRFDSDDFIEKIIAGEEYMIRKYPKIGTIKGGESNESL